MVSLYLVTFDRLLLCEFVQSPPLNPKVFLASTTSLGKVHEEPLPLAYFEPGIHDL